MEWVVDLDTVATLVAVAAGVLGLGATVLASNRRTRTELKGDITGFRTELKGDIAALRTEVKGDIAGLRTELKSDIAGLDDRVSRLDDRVSRLDDRVSRLDDRVYALAAGLAPRLVPAASGHPDGT